jgi:hypothetical protein
MARYHACVTSVATTQAIRTLLHSAMPTDIHVHHFLLIPTSEFHTSTMWSSNFQAGCCTSMLFMPYILRKLQCHPHQHSIRHHTVVHTYIVVLIFQQFKNKINTKHVILLFFQYTSLDAHLIFLHVTQQTSPAHSCAHPETVRRPVSLLPHVYCSHWLPPSCHATCIS